MMFYIALLEFYIKRGEKIKMSRQSVAKWMLTLVVAWLLVLMVVVLFSYSSQSSMSWSMTSTTSSGSGYTIAPSVGY
jgi:hypothetical protein